VLPRRETEAGSRIHRWETGGSGWRGSASARRTPTSALPSLRLPPTAPKRRARKTRRACSRRPRRVAAGGRSTLCGFRGCDPVSAASSASPPNTSPRHAPRRPSGTRTRYGPNASHLEELYLDACEDSSPLCSSNC
jgi:hypothetical protein